MLSTSALFEPTGSHRRPLSKKENDAGWLSYVQALEAIGRSKTLVKAFEALSASTFDHCQPVDAPEALLSDLVDADLDSLDDLMRKSTTFERPANRVEPFTSLRYRLRKEMEASALLTKERMRRRIEAVAKAPSDSEPPLAPVSPRSARAGI
ncbi:hypothetical protein ACG04R_16285 [Roseateles sp. BYS78W]|uniref:Uncharacterized protein n=1 Tax=Pelomonas candidula TaxID=3299025 RepID=A0ABW7HE98_9BURK